MHVFVVSCVYGRDFNDKKNNIVVKLLKPTYNGRFA